PNSDVTVNVAQSATKATTTLVGISATAGQGLNNLSLGTSTHATTTFEGTVAAGSRAGLHGITRRGTAATANIDATQLTPTASTGTTNLTIANGDASASNTITLDNTKLVGGDAASATYLAQQINSVAGKTGVLAKASGTSVNLTSVNIGGTTGS